MIYPVEAPALEASEASEATEIQEPLGFLHRGLGFGDEGFMEGYNWKDVEGTSWVCVGVKEVYRGCLGLT